MRTFLTRLAANAGSALAAGATVLAVGAALGAVGLTEAQSTKHSPFDNGWVLLGVAIMALAALWSVVVFILAMVGTAKHERFQELLGDALHDGERLEATLAEFQLIKAWGQQAHDLIEAALGPGEGRLFLAEWDLGGNVKVSPPTKHGVVWLRRRLQRLTRLMDRMHGLHVSPMAKMSEWAYQSSSPAISSSVQT